VKRAPMWRRRWRSPAQTRSCDACRRVLALEQAAAGSFATAAQDRYESPVADVNDAGAPPLPRNWISARRLSETRRDDRASES
jgi:hypothetical protein